MKPLIVPAEVAVWLQGEARARGFKGPYDLAVSILRDAALQSMAARSGRTSTSARLTIEQIVTRTMPADEFFERMAAAGYDSDQATQARTDALTRGTLREGRGPYTNEDGTPGQRYIIFPTTEGKP